jgi:hypothetical protein
MFNALKSIINGVMDAFGDAGHAQDAQDRPTPFDIAAVLHLLSSPTSPLVGRLPLLPPETVLDILEYAEYWQSLRAIQATPARITSQDQGGNVLHLSTPVFPARSVPARMVRRIEIRTVSHDQGWSSDNDALHRTYEASWTWFEAALLDPPTEPDEDGFAENGPRYEVVRNVHAGRDFKEHRIVWGPDHPLVQQARPGQRVGVFTRAMFPGWVNFVREIEIVVYLGWP